MVWMKLRVEVVEFGGLRSPNVPDKWCDGRYRGKFCSAIGSFIE